MTFISSPAILFHLPFYSILDLSIPQSFRLWHVKAFQRVATCYIPPSPCPRPEPLFSLAVRERYENRRKNGHNRFLSRVTAKRKALGVSALTIECEICWVFLIGNHFPMQNVYFPTQTIFVLCKSLYINGEFFEWYFRGTNGGQNFAYKKKEKQ